VKTLLRRSQRSPSEQLQRGFVVAMAKIVRRRATEDQKEFRLKSSRLITNMKLMIHQEIPQPPDDETHTQVQYQAFPVHDQNPVQ
jgi:hypothetical protein